MCLVMQAIWDPRLAFTGTTILGVNPENGQHYFKPLHAAFCKCGCYSTAGNNMSTLHCCLPQASHVLLCLADLVWLYPYCFVLRVSHLVRTMFACRQVQQACGRLGLK